MVRPGDPLLHATILLLQHPPPSDLDRRSGILTVTPAVVELHPEDHPTGGRYLVQPHPKNKQSRRLRLDPTLVEAITAHVDQHDLTPGRLLFAMRS